MTDNLCNPININVLQTSLTKYGSLNVPTDVASVSLNCIPLQKYVQKVFPFSKISETNVQTFVYNTSSIIGEITKMLYLKIHLPAQYAYAIRDIGGFQPMAGLKYINAVQLKLNGETLETITTDTIYLGLKKLYGENWPHFCKEYIGTADLELYMCPTIGAEIVPQTEFLVPLPFSILVNRDRFKNILINNTNIEIEVKYNHIDSLYMRSHSTFFKRCDGKNNRLIIESCKYDTQIMENKNVIFKAAEFLHPDAASKRPYFFLCKRNESYTSSFAEINEYQMDMRNGNSVTIRGICKLGHFSAPSTLFYGYDCTSSALTFLNCFVLNSDLKVRSKIHVFNFKTGLFISTNSLESGNLKCEAPDANSYIFSVKSNELQTHLSVTIVCNRPWFSLSEDVFYDFDTFVQNLGRPHVFNIFSISKCTFLVKNYDANHMYFDETLQDNGNVKLLGGLYITRNKNQAVVGFTEYVNSEKNAINYLKILASSPADTHMPKNVFVLSNFFYNANPLNNSFDLDNSIKIDFEQLKLSLNSSNERVFDKEVKKVFSSSLDGAISPVPDYANFLIDFSGLDTMGSVKVSRGSRLTFSLDSRLILNGLVGNYDISSHLRLSKFVFNLTVIQTQKEYMYYLNHTLFAVGSANSQLKTIKLIENAILKNYSC